MKPIQNKWFMSTSMFVYNQKTFILGCLVLLFTSFACQKNKQELVHIKGRIVTKGTGDPILMGGIKFGIYEAQPIKGVLSQQEYLLIDSFETNANGMFEHSFVRPEFLENLSVRQISVVPGYSPNPYSYQLVGDLKNLVNVEQYKTIVFEFAIDNRNGSPFDVFHYYVPGSQITTYIGNQLYKSYHKALAYSPLRILIADSQLDTQYNIDLYFQTLDSARYTFVP